MQIKNKKYLIILILFILTLLIFILVNLTKKDDKSIMSSSNYYKNYLKEHEKDINTIIKDRYTYISKSTIFIGKNKKELDNNYFDIAIENKNGQAFILLNKLVKDKYNNILDNVYLSEIIDLINIVFNLNLYQNQKNILFNEIKENYIALRSVENVDNLIRNINQNIKVIDKYKISFDIDDNILVLNINI